jgi:tetratricopeptide (TPR) repeat protein
MMPSALRLGLSLENRPVVIEHHGYGDPEELKKKAARNIALLLEEYDDSGPDAVMAVEIADSYSIVDDRGSAMTWYGRVLDIQGCAKNMPVIASQAHLGLGNVHSRDGRYGRAVEHFEKSLELCPGRPDALYCMAVAQDLDGKADVAIGTLQGIIGSGDKRIVQVSIDFRQTAIKAFIRLARLLGMNNRFDELKHCVERALEQYPGRAEIHNMAGLAYFHRGMYMEALHAYEKSLQIAVTQNLDAYIGLCVIYRMAGREDVMRKTLEQIGPLFCSMPRFHAFCECMNAAQGSVPGEIDREKIAEEKKYLKDIYRL